MGGRIKSLNGEEKNAIAACGSKWFLLVGSHPTRKKEVSWGQVSE